MFYKLALELSKVPRRVIAKYTGIKEEHLTPEILEEFKNRHIEDAHMFAPSMRHQVAAQLVKKRRQMRRAKQINEIKRAVSSKIDGLLNAGKRLFGGGGALAPSRVRV